jgi:hypothetical protein
MSPEEQATETAKAVEAAEAARQQAEAQLARHGQAMAVREMR